MTSCMPLVFIGLACLAGFAPSCKSPPSGATAGATTETNAPARPAPLSADPASKPSKPESPPAGTAAEPPKLPETAFQPKAGY